MELGARAFWLLLAAGGVSGWVSLWTFRRCSDRAKLRAAANRMLAHLLELRLFSAEPLLVMRAQWDLLAANAELLRRTIGPSLILFVPFAVLLIGMNALFGRGPLQPGRAALVTVQYNRLSMDGLPGARLETPAGIQIETPPVRVPRLSQISWRVRPTRMIEGDLQIRCAKRIITKSISSRAGLQWLSDTRTRLGLGFILDPAELPFSDSDVNSISVQYPRATIFGWSWLAWFTLAFLASALLSGLVNTYLRH